MNRKGTQGPGNLRGSESRAGPGAGRTLLGMPVLVVAGIALVGGLVAVGMQRAAAADREIADLKSDCRTRGSAASKAIAADALRRRGSSDARTALDELAASADDRVAAAAIVAIGRGDASGARGKLKAIFESSGRSARVRSAAFSAWARLEAKDGATWSAISGYGRRHASEGSPLEESVLAVENALFPRSGR